MKTHKYITTTLPYINSTPHIGHALEFVQADSLKRFFEMAGEKVFLNIGTDEYGTKVSQKAKEENLSPKRYADMMAEKYKELLRLLNIQPTNFIRTTDPTHKKAVIKMWNTLFQKGDIYKKKHKGLYCVGCELFKKEKELINGECEFHIDQKLEIIEEENYFFKLSKYKDELLNVYRNQKDFVVPDLRLNEIDTFVSKGLEDISVSREKKRLQWGIEVPNDKDQVVYVWFDALTNYLTTIGWGKSFYEILRPNWKDYWPVIQLAGKDNLRQQSCIFQAMLLALDLPTSKQIFIHGFLTQEGQKMSKTLGNVITPKEIVDKYGVDFFRFFMLTFVNPYEDTDIRHELIDEAYNAHFVNGIGNLTSRILTLTSTHLKSVHFKENKLDEEFTRAFEEFNFKKAGTVILTKVKELDSYISSTEPYKVIKEDKEKGINELNKIASKLYDIAFHLEPFTPELSKKIISLIKQNKKPTPLFVKI